MDLSWVSRGWQSSSLYLGANGITNRGPLPPASHQMSNSFCPNEPWDSSLYDMVRCLWIIWTLQNCSSQDFINFLYYSSTGKSQIHHSAENPHMKILISINEILYEYKQSNNSYILLNNPIAILLWYNFKNSFYRLKSPIVSGIKWVIFKV